MNCPKISIIVPVYNVEAYLPQCLDSIIAQTLKDWECILVDDGSKDMSGKICDDYSKSDGRFVVVHKKNEGVSKARATAFEISRGEYITFIDSDDFVDDDYIAHLYGKIIEYKVDLVGCQYYVKNGDSVTTDLRPVVGCFTKEKIKQILQSNALYDRNIGKSGISSYLWTKMIRRELVKSSLYAGEGLWMGEDHAIVIEMLRKAKSIFISSEPHYYYVCHSSQVTNSQGKRRFEADTKLWKRLNALDKDNDLSMQLSYKIFNYIHFYLIHQALESRSYKDYKVVFNEVLSEEIVKHYVFDYHLPELLLSEKIHLLLLKYRQCFVFWLRCNYRNIIK